MKPVTKVRIFSSEDALEQRKEAVRQLVEKILDEVGDELLSVQAVALSLGVVDFTFTIVKEGE